MTEAERPYTIRPATSMDVVNITRLLRSAWDEGPTNVLRVNEAKAIKWIMDSIDTAFVLVADLQGRLIGTIAFVPMRPPWSDDLLMGKLWFFARPLFRTREAVLTDLLAAAEKFMDVKRIPMKLDMELESLTPPGFSRTLANRRGYSQIGGGAFLRLPLAVERDEVSKLQEAVA